MTIETTGPVIASCVLAGAALVLSPDLAATQQAAPPAAYSTAAAFDEARGRLVVFGGYVNGRYSGDTWEWDGTRWHRGPAEGPAARNAPAMAWDARRQRMVLFGGDTRETTFGDTWEYDGTTWTRVAERGPSPRSLMRLAFDSRRGRTVLFGGAVRSGQSMTMLRDTWEWDGAVWTQVSNEGPDGRFLYAMAYDAAIDRTVLFGGTALTTMPPAAGDLRGDTWEWDGRAWQRAEGAGPAGRDHITMAYDAARQRLVLFGGSPGPAAPFDDTWMRSGRSWTRVDASGLAARTGHQMAYDGRAGRVLLFGGFPGGGQPGIDIWTLTESTWTRIDR